MSKLEQLQQEAREKIKRFQPGHSIEWYQPQIDIMLDELIAQAFQAGKDTVVENILEVLVGRKEVMRNIPEGGRWLSLDEETRMTIISIVQAARNT